MKSRLTASVALALSVCLAVTMQQQPTWAAKPKPFTPPAAAQQPSVAVRGVPVKAAPGGFTKLAGAQSAPVWPSATSSDVAVAGTSGAPVSFRAARATAGQATAARVRPSKMHVDVLDQATSNRAGVAGLLFRVRRADGDTAAAPVGVAVDYSKFATAYGADWGTRLRLVRVPECALTTPQRAECRGTAIATENNVAAKQATAEVAVGGAQLMALAAAPSGPAGSYGATSLNASGTWSAGSSSGNFSWSFPMRAPPAMGGPAPTLELGYSSQSVDGRMAASNNQPSEAGEGFELATSGYIERSYKTCSDDTSGGNNAGAADKNADDQCWVTDNASLSLNGSGGDLIKDATDPDRWHLRNDDGSRIERRTNAGNGAKDGEWWVVTTVNGTQYWFGRNRLPGSPGAVTKSTWTLPVFGNHTGEPCHQDAFTASSCVQAWRWNLDYVVDPHGNTMSYWYGTDTNNYQSGTGNVQTYIRAGYLDHVDYGTRVEPDLSTGADTVFTGHASAQIDFGYDDRCLSDCGTHDAKRWPDTPWDLACSVTTSCDARMPSFYSTRRLGTVTTSTYNATTGKFRPVERWTLTHSFPDPQDGTRAGLWLSRIGHTGLVGTTTPMPDVTFTGKPMANRVDAVDNAPAMNWPRLTDINTETGAIVHVDYLDTDCVAGSSVPSAPESNTKRCYPVKWAPPGFPKQTDYFNRYVVNEVTETDRTGGSPRVLHHYTYFGAPAWHYTDDDGLIADDAKTWSQWRGYGTVGVTTGDAGSGRTYTESVFFRGMNGDHLPSGTRTASVTDSRGVSVPDDDAYAGMTRETRVLNGPSGAEVSGDIYDPWQSAATATRRIAGVQVDARYVNTEGTHSRITLDHAPWTRTTYTKTTFDQYGMEVRQDDFGDEAVTGDEQCTVTTFEPRNSTTWLMSLAHRVQTYALSCDKTTGTVAEADVIGDARTLYDGHGYGVAPTRGDPTETDQMTAYNSGSPTYTQVTRTGYDVLGRAIDSWDALDRHSGTTYTPLTTGPVTQTADVNPLGWTTTTTVEPAWGLATSTVDVNQVGTALRYDGLGRLTGMWSAGRDPDRTTADVAYDYLIRPDGVNAVTTSHLNPKGEVTKSYALYDGLLRPRQTQTASPKGGRILTDTFYDAAGRSVLDYGAYYDKTGAPGTTLVQPLTQQDVPNQTRLVYDGAGRAVSSIFQPLSVERWRTTTSYGGDHTDVEPPTGATASATWTDARGRTTQLRQYPTRVATGADYDHTDYAYNRKGLLDSVTTPDGSRWTYGYDLRGRQTTSVDPDAGKTTNKYDDGGRLVTTMDANSLALTYTYDALDRKIGLYKGTTVTSGGQVAQWDYDQATFTGTTTPVKGQLFQSSRIDSNRRYVSAVNQYDQHYRPTRSSVTIPSSETGLGGTYSFSTGYNLDGSVNAVDYPQTGDLQKETLLHGYTDFDQPYTLMNLYGTQAEASIVSDSQYDALAHATQHTLYTGFFSSTGAKAYLNFETDLTTGRLNEISLHRDGVAPNTVTDLHYTYDDAGNVTKMADKPTGGGYTDIQCFTYDRYQRLSEAWTPAADNCAAAPTPAGLGGPSPYWQSYTYTLGGARSKLVDHATANGDATTDYTFTDSATADPAAGQPHVLRSATTTDDKGTRSAAYTYDKAGNTKTRPGPNGTQTLVWDNEGNLQSVTDTAGSTSYLYDADGNRLISRDGTGKTLYLPNEELRYTNSTGLGTCTRYYSFGGGTVAQRTAAGLTWLASDHQGTQNVSVNEQTQAATIRRQTPFGTARGQAVPWVNTKGFVGGTTDPTGLTHLGAREYDPALGRFISVDPVLDTSDPQSMEGYAYADNSPVVHADPSGQMIPRDEAGSHTATPDNLTYPQTDDKPTKKSKPSKCGMRCKAKKAMTSGANWVDDHKAAIAGVVVGVAVGVGCGALIGWTGVGAVACGALAGAAGSMVQYAIETKVEHKGNFSLGGMLIQGAIGGIAGGLMGGLGSIAGQGIKAGVTSLISGAGTKAAAAAGRAAVKKEASSIASGITRNAFTKSAAKSSEGAAAGAPKGCNSFTSTTAVVMADGSKKAIGKVKVGDRVRVTDPITGTKSIRTVEVVHVNNDKAFTNVRVRANGHEALIHTTQYHPFWNATKKMWVNAGDLSPGDHLKSASGATVAVAGIHNFAGAHWMYDLTVDTIHTYYVLAGTTPVLVHNCGDGLLHPGRNGADDSPQDWIPMNSWTRNGANLAEGNHHFVVMPDKSVRTFHESIWETAPGAGHTSLSRGKGVLAAGTFDVGPGGVINRFDNFSGHYRPGASTEGAIRDAFGRNGFDLSNAHWDPFEFN